MRYIILCILWPTALSAQNVLYISSYLGNYHMGSMKQLQEEMVQSMNKEEIPAKAVSTFPASIQVEVGMDIPDTPASHGFFINYGVTEGRIYYGDYSGEIDVHQDLKRLFFGYKISKPLGKFFDLSWKLGPQLSYMTMNSLTRLSEEEVAREELQFRAVGGSAYMGAGCTIPYKRFRFAMGGGLEVNANGKSMLVDGDGAYLIKNNGKPALLNWSGLRAGVTVGYSFL